MQFPTPKIGSDVLYRDANNHTYPAKVIAAYGPFNVDVVIFRQDPEPTMLPVQVYVARRVTHAQPDNEPGCYPSWHWSEESIQLWGLLHPESKQQCTDHVDCNTLIDFSRALVHVQAGKSVTRHAWPTDWRLRLVRPKGAVVGNIKRTNVNSTDRLRIFYPIDGHEMAIDWTPTTVDLLSNDWCIRE